MKKSAMPVSKAKNAHQLLGEIRKLILEEPKRYDQDAVLIQDDTAFRERYGTQLGKPACGTVGCVAGWVVALKGIQDETLGVCGNAALILGLRCCGELFLYDAAGERNHRRPRAHAERGAAHIARFRRKYAKELKAKRV